MRILSLHCFLYSVFHATVCTHTPLSPYINPTLKLAYTTSLYRICEFGYWSQVHVYSGWRKIKFICLAIYLGCIEKIKMQVRSKYIFERTLSFNINIQPKRRNSMHCSLQQKVGENIWVCRKSRRKQGKGRNTPPQKREKINVHISVCRGCWFLGCAAVSNHSRFAA